MKRKVLALACTLALSAGLLAGCGSSTDTAAEAESTVAAVESTEAAEAESTEAESTETAAEVESKGTITVAATPVPHAEILEAAKDLMAAEGWDLEIVEFTDYVQPNEVVESGDVDANYFQHVNYLNSYNEEKGTHLAIAGKIHYEPLGLYPGKQSDLAAITDGAEIAVPNDTTNCARALLLLEAEGLIKLDPEAGITATENDIVENPHNIKIVPLAAEQVARTLEDVDFGVINGNYAMEAGLTSADAVALESADSEAIQQYVNVVAVKEGNENNEAIKALVAALQSQSAPVQKITIIPRTSGALGYTMQVDEGEHYLMTKTEMENKIATLTGGRAAEELIFHEITTGASNDIEQATKLARSMVTRLGMTEEFDMMATEVVANRYLGGDAALQCSETTAGKIDAKVLALIKEAHAKARTILQDNRDKLDVLAQYLLEKETITGEQFMALLQQEQAKEAAGENKPEV